MPSCCFLPKKHYSNHYNKGGADDVHNEIYNNMNNIIDNNSKIRCVLKRITLLQRGGVGIPRDIISPPVFFRFAR